MLLIWAVIVLCGECAFESCGRADRTQEHNGNGSEHPRSDFPLCNYSGTLGHGDGGNPFPVCMPASLRRHLPTPVIFIIKALVATGLSIHHSRPPSSSSMPTSHITSIPMSGMVQVIPLCDAMPPVFSLSDLILDQDLYTPKLFYALLVVILAYCVSFCVRSNIVNENGYAIPPGPLLRYALLGKYPERALQAWAKKYGPLFSLFVGNQLFIVISDPQIAHKPRRSCMVGLSRLLHMEIHGKCILPLIFNDVWI